MKAYLLNAPFMEHFVRCGRWQGVAAKGGTMYYPIWLSYATGVLEKEGHKVRLIDAIANKWDLDRTIEDANKFNPDLVVIDSNFSSLKNDIEIARRLKKETEAISVLVGPPASQFPERILNGGVDIVARFEFDFTIRDIARSIEKGKNLEDIKGISYKREERIIYNQDRESMLSKELDQIPFVSEIYKKHLNIKDYFLNHALYPTVQIFTGRGCPNFCTFCSWTETLMGRKYRVRSVENVVDEFEYIQEKLRIKEVFIEDDAFTLSKKRVLNFCAAIKTRKIEIPWSCQSRATLDRETMKAMKNAGCRLLDVGYESGSNEILKNIRKGTNVKQLCDFTRAAKEAKLKILADFVIGFPGETKESAEQTIKFIKYIKPDLLQVAVSTPIPGTEFYKWCKENKYLVSDDLANSLDNKGFQKCIVSYPTLTNNDIEYFANKALREYYLNRSYIPIALKNVCTREFLAELKVLVRSAFAFIKYYNYSKS